MPSVVSVNSSVVRPEDALVSVFDRGFLFGDSVYETFRTYDGIPWLEDEHLVRLGNSADRMGLPLPGGLARVRDDVARALNESHEATAAVRIVVTRGAKVGLIDLDPGTAGTPDVYVLVRPYTPVPEATYRSGIELALVGVRRNARDALDPAIKSGNYLNNMLALREAKSRGAYECVMLNKDGFLAEGSTSNVFLVKDGVLATPALDSGILAGVTRAYLLGLARAEGIPVREILLRESDLRAADEVFISGSLKEVLPVARVDGTPVGAGRPGALTLRLLHAYRSGIAAARRVR
ncbi:MAG: aminotransferase class IV [Planctomycetes bacterium]|nr:aminotransferase class IV [Planctomycetota bacterium]MCC7171621.1 aminotransferase class IV [Planctomycetota bacterium]